MRAYAMIYGIEMQIVSVDKYRGNVVYVSLQGNMQAIVPTFQITIR